MSQLVPAITVSPNIELKDKVNDSLVNLNTITPIQAEFKSILKIFPYLIFV